MPRLIGDARVLEILQARIKAAGTALALAEELGLEPTRISEVLHGRRPTKRMLEALGLKERRMYEVVE